MARPARKTKIAMIGRRKRRTKARNLANKGLIRDSISDLGKLPERFITNVIVVEYSNDESYYGSPAFGIIGGGW